MNSPQERGRREGTLEAPARVVSGEETSPEALEGDTVSTRTVIGRHTGFAALEQALLECVPGRSRPRTTGDCDEVLFVLSGEGLLHIAGHAHALAPETGAYLAPGDSYELENSSRSPLRLVAVRIPDLETGSRRFGARRSANGLGAGRVHRLADQERAAATAQREFRIVSDPATGLRSATQFVGSIPPLRAPEHFHPYDEVIYVLDGEGLMHVDGAHHPLTAGSSVQLPARTVHCLENTSEHVMRVVAVFRPAGSPAEAYYPDGSPAYAPQS